MLHVDAKGWRTLPVTRPGQPTRRYIDGQRTRHVLPPALFRFMVMALYMVLILILSVK